MEKSVLEDRQTICIIVRFRMNWPAMMVKERKRQDRKKNQNRKDQSEHLQNTQKGESERQTAEASAGSVHRRERRQCPRWKSEE